MSDQTGILLKWFSNRGIILAKGQLDHLYTFWTMPILIFSPVQIIMGHPLSRLEITKHCEQVCNLFLEIFNTYMRMYYSWGKLKRLIKCSPMNICYILYFSFKYWFQILELKFICSEKATKFCEISTVFTKTDKNGRLS